MSKILLAGALLAVLAGCSTKSGVRTIGTFDAGNRDPTGNEDTSVPTTLTTTSTADGTTTSQSDGATTTATLADTASIALDAAVGSPYNPTCDTTSCIADGGTQCITAAAGSICVHPCPGNVCPQLTQTAYCDQYGGTYCQ